jgi:hypothetical protein
MVVEALVPSACLLTSALDTSAATTLDCYNIDASTGSQSAIALAHLLSKMSR